MDVNEIYAEYSPQVREYMSNLITCLEDDYGKIPESFRVSLDLIALNYDIILKCKADIKENGLLRTDNLKRTFKNQHITILNQAQGYLQALLKTFALTPMTRSKMKALERKDEEETTQEYIDDLIS